MHDVVWTPEKVRRFWDFYGANEALQDTYFTRAVGHSIVRYAASRIPIGRAFDMGCGRGDLLGHLLKEHEAAGSDQSPESVAIANRRFDGNDRFQGAHVGSSSFPNHDFSTVFLIEVVEHVEDRALANILAEARRLLRPGGHLVITTPNEENLDVSKRMCPDCSCIFHQMQHVRSWSAATLAATAERHGFRTLTCKPTLFSARTGALAHLDHLRYARRKLPHLVFIGEALQ